MTIFIARQSLTRAQALAIRAPVSQNPPENPSAKDRFVNLLMNALLELLAAVPTIGGDIGQAVQAWHNAHGDQAKTAAAVTTATQLIQGAGALAISLEPAPTPAGATGATGATGAS